MPAADLSDGLGNMSSNGRTIRLFLADGSPTGIITAEVMNWTGHVLYAPRARIVDILRRPESNRTGIYILVGQDPDNPSQHLVYIGESDNVGARLTQHNRDENKSFWEFTCIITSKDSNLTKAHVRYLESQLIGLALKEGRARLFNGTAPDYGYLPEADIADMEYFVFQLQTLLPVLGLDYFRPTPQFSRAAKGKAGAGVQLDSDKSPTGENGSNFIDERRSLGPDQPTDEGHKSPEFQFTDRLGNVRAKAVEADGQMIILQGSEAREEELPSLASNVKTFRAQLRQSGKLVPSGKTGVLRFSEDVAFSSPSAAAQAVMGTSRNGRTDWTVAQTGETYADWQEGQIARTPIDREPNPT